MMLSCRRPLRVLLPLRSSGFLPQKTAFFRTMATERARLPHEERTADEPRDPNLHTVILKQIQEVNSNIRLFTLSAKDQVAGIPVRLLEPNG